MGTYTTTLELGACLGEATVEVEYDYQPYEAAILYGDDPHPSVEGVVEVTAIMVYGCDIFDETPESLLEKLEEEILESLQ